MKFSYLNLQIIHSRNKSNNSNSDSLIVDNSESEPEYVRRLLREGDQKIKNDYEYIKEEYNNYSNIIEGFHKSISAFYSRKYGYPISTMYPHPSNRTYWFLPQKEISLYCTNGFSNKDFISYKRNQDGNQVSIGNVTYKYITDELIQAKKNSTEIAMKLRQQDSTKREEESYKRQQEQGRKKAQAESKELKDSGI